MPNDLLGMDVEAAQGLAAGLRHWHTDVDAVVSEIIGAEILAELYTDTVQMLWQIATDGTTMATRVERAANALSSFSISMGSPFVVGPALARVKDFGGGDNDPELDIRLRELRALVDAHTETDEQAALVMADLLTADGTGLVRFRDTTEIDAARAEVERLTALHERGGISANDPRIDAAVSQLDAVLAVHASSQEQGTELLRSFLDDRTLMDSTWLLASVITGESVETVAVAHANDLGYDDAAVVVALNEVDRLTEAMTGLPDVVAQEMGEQRRSLLLDLGAVDEPRVLASLTTMLSAGVPALQAFAQLDDHVAASIQRDKVRAVELAFRLDAAGAELLLAEMERETLDLIGRGYAPEHAGDAVTTVHLLGLDMTLIVSYAEDEQVSLETAANRVRQAQSLDFTLDELDAYEGFVEHFSDFDTAIEGHADGIVSVQDLDHIVNNSGDYADKEIVAAASAILRSRSLRNRLDRARDNHDVLGAEPFGSDRSDDNMYSLTDLDVFAMKQQTNFYVGGRLAEIDVAAQGGDITLTDGQMREEDFEYMRNNADDFGLTAEELVAIENVLAGDWYDTDFWDRHGDVIILWSAVFAGGAVFVATGGTAGAVSAALISTAAAVGAGASIGAGLTLAENAITDDPLTEDLVENTVLGAVGGSIGAGVFGAPSALAKTSPVVRTLGAVGLGADVSGLVAAGGADPLLRLVLDDEDVDNAKDGAQVSNYVLGAATVAGGLSTAGASHVVHGGLRNPVVHGELVEQLGPTLVSGPVALALTSLQKQ